MSAFTDFLEWLGRPQQQVANVLAGKPVSALKQGAQTVLDVWDAFLPGDWLPDITTAEDRVSGSELLHLPESSPWLAKFAADVGVGIATDPFTYVTGGLGAARSTAGNVAKEALIGSSAALAKAGKIDDIVRGIQHASPELKNVAEEATARWAQVLEGVAPESAAAENLQIAIKSGRENVKRQQELIRIMEEAGDYGENLTKAKDYLRNAEGELSVRGRELNRLKDSVQQPILQQYAAEEGRRAALRALPDNIERGISRTGRKLLKDEGRSASDLVSDVMASVGGDYSEQALRRAMVDDARLAPYFNQGGIRFMGKQIASDDTLAGAASAIKGIVPEGWAKKVAAPLTAAKSAVWRTMGWDQAPATVVQSLRHGPAQIGSQYSSTHAQYIEDLFKNAGVKAGSEEDKVIAQIFDNLVYADGKPVGLISDMNAPIADRIYRLQSSGSAGDVNWKAINEVVNGLEQNSLLQWDELVQNGIVSGETGRSSYLSRLYDSDPEKIAEVVNADDIVRGNVKATKERVLETDEQLLDYLQNTEGVVLNRSAAERSLTRALQQGGLIARHETAKALLGSANPGVSAETMTLMSEVANAIAKQDPQLGRWIGDVIGGMKPRNNFLKGLATANRVFKPAAVYGFAIPRFAAITRNELGGIYQALSGIGGEAALNELKRAPQQLWGAVANGFAKAFGKDPKFGNELAAKLRMFDDITKSVGSATGDVSQVRSALKSADPMLLEAWDAGVFDGFVHSEELLKRMSKMPSQWQNLMDMPGYMFQHVESGMRLGAFMDLRKAGVSKNRAAEFVREAFLDYQIKNNANRTLRDIIPFAAFTTQTLRQQGKLLVDRPGVIAAYGHLLGNEDENNVPEWIAGQAHTRIGTDAEGNAMYATGLGVPIEAADVLPNISGDVREIGMDLRRGVLGATHPLIKTLFSVVSGRDPYFDSPVLSYSRTPEVLQAVGAPEESEVGRQYQFLKGTGMIQPAVAPLTMLDKALDDRKPLAARALNLLTGISVVSVDEQRAEISNLARQLELDPTVRSMQMFYGDSENDLLRQYKAAQAAKRRAKDQD